MKKKILLTRNISENKLLRGNLQGYGFEFYELPLLEQVPSDFDFALCQKYQHLIITSKYAATLIPKSQFDQSVWVVGSKSAKLLEGKNYHVSFIARDVNELYSELVNNKIQSYAYLSGNVITKEMPDFVDRFIIYDTMYKQSLTSCEIDIIKLPPDIIPVFSSNCAKTLVNLLETNKLTNFLERTLFIAISSKVRDVLLKSFSNVKTADKIEEIEEKIIQYV